MKYTGPKDRRDAANSIDTDPNDLRELSKYQFIFVREAVASNPSTSPDVLSGMIPANLASENHFRIALSLIKNPQASAEMCSRIIRLLIDNVEEIEPRDYYPTQLLDAATSCENVPVEALLLFADSSRIPKHIRQRIARPESRKVLLQELLNDPSPKVASRARRALEEDT